MGKGNFSYFDEHMSNLLVQLSPLSGNKLDRFCILSKYEFMEPVLSNRNTISTQLLVSLAAMSVHVVK